MNNTLSIGFWRSLTCQNSHVDISSLGRLYWLISMYCCHKIFHFLSVSDGPTSILSDIAINLRFICLWHIFEKPKILARDVFERSQRRDGKDIFFEICSRRLKDVTQKTSFLRCFWDVLKTSQKRHLFWDFSKRSLRCLSQWKSDWDLSETSHSDLVTTTVKWSFCWYSFQFSPEAALTWPLYVHITLPTDTGAEYRAFFNFCNVKNMLKLLAFKWLLNE